MIRALMLIGMRMDVYMYVDMYVDVDVDVYADDMYMLMSKGGSLMCMYMRMCMLTGMRM